MLRPQHGTSRWLLLFCACIALAATAAVPRGLLRATVLSQLDRAVETSAGLPGEAYDVVEPGAELPGVRVVMSREERDTDHLPELDVPVPGAHRAPVDGSGFDSTLSDERPQTCSAPAGTCAPRAPPASI